MNCHGVPEYVIVRGRVCLEDGLLRVAEGHGQFVETPCYPPYVYDALNGVKTKNNDENGFRNGFQSLDIHENKIDIPEPDILPEKYIPGPAFSISGESVVSNAYSARGQRPDGQRNLQTSTFSISGEYSLYFLLLTKNHYTLSIYFHICRGN